MWCNMKIEKNKKNLNTNKSKRKILFYLKWVGIICLTVIIIELLIMTYIYFQNEKNINYIDTVNDVLLVDDYYLVSGSSNYRYSKLNKRKTYKYITEDSEKKNIVLEQAKLAKYDLNMNLLSEYTFDNPYDTTYYSSIKVDDGYVAVGSYVKDYEQITLNTRNALIVKYDFNGNIIWYKDYQVLGDSEFYKIIEADNGYLVCGQSIYENGEIGNHINGGGIIVKYDYDGNIVAKNNYGGNKSGKFNDIIALDDGYLVCGLDGSNYGILVKFKKDFNRDEDDNNLISKKIVYYETYANTDNMGFIDMEVYNNKIYIACASNINDKKDDNGNNIYSYDAGLVIYDLKGKYINQYTFGGENIDRYNSINVSQDGIYLIGITKSSKIDIDNIKENINQLGIIIKYDFDYKIINKTFFGSNNNDILSKIIKTDDNNYLVAGYSNSNIKEINGNGKDYKIFLKKYNLELGECEG